MIVFDSKSAISNNLFRCTCTHKGLAEIHFDCDAGRPRLDEKGKRKKVLSYNRLTDI